MTNPILFDTPASWRAEDLRRDTSWIYPLGEADRRILLDAVRAAHVPGKSLFEYSRADFPFGDALCVLRKAFAEIHDGRGIALVKGLPRAGVSPQEFELLTWAIGLHFGVARPQGKASQYLSAVKNTGTVYRSPTGRGYSSNAELDFHTDGADIVALTCYNTARTGGMSFCTSSVAAFQQICNERPDLVETLCGCYPFSRQGEEAPGEEPYIEAPVFGIEDNRLFCKWVRNRMESAVQAYGAPLTVRQRAAVDFLDEVVRREALRFTMRLEAGDMQILNTHVTLHSRTEFEDYEEQERKRLLFRLWLAPPDSLRLPEGWRFQYGTVESCAVRGGAKGQQFDDIRRAFDMRQARECGMRIPA